jgi:hypothetical protein
MARLAQALLPEPRHRTPIASSAHSLIKSLNLLLHTMNIEEEGGEERHHIKPKPYPGLTITKEFQQSANFITGSMRSKTTMLPFLLGLYFFARPLG